MLSIGGYISRICDAALSGQRLPPPALDMQAIWGAQSLEDVPALQLHWQACCC